MKNMVKVVGVIAIIAVIGFSMTACEEDEKFETLTVTITGLSPNTEYVVSYLDADSPYGFSPGEFPKSDADGKVTQYVKSNESGNLWGKNIYITYKEWKPGIMTNEYISKIPYTLESGRLPPLNAANDFNLRQ